MEQVAAAFGDIPNLIFEVSEIGAEEGRSDLEQGGDCIGSAASVVKRALLLLLPLLLITGAILALGRPPSTYALEQDIARHQAERRNQYNHFTYEISKALRAKADVSDLRQQRKDALLASIETELGGWRVVYLPPGSRHPHAGAWSPMASLDPSTPTDPVPLRGAWIVRARPESWAARVASSFGLAPDHED